MDAILHFSPNDTKDAMEVASGVSDAATLAGLHPQRVNSLPVASLVRDLVRLWKPVGATVFCGSSSWPKLDLTVFGGFPAVSICHDRASLPPGAPAVVHDSAGTGRAAARELLGTGRTSFAFVHNGVRRDWSDERARAFAETVRMHGFQCRVLDPEVEDDEDLDESAWHSRLRAFLRALPLPCALFAASDRTAADVLGAARHEGLEVPADVAVLGVDDNERICESTSPSLSSIAPDFRLAGRLAVETLLAATGRGGGASRPPESHGAPPIVFGDAHIARRASTNIRGAQDPVVRDALEKIRVEAKNGLRPADVVALFPCTRRVADVRFRRAAGHTIGEEIRAVRLREVQRLLSDPSVQIKAIGDFCGFSAPGSLRKFFRRETGTSLRAWRAAALRDRRSR